MGVLGAGRRATWRRNAFSSKTMPWEVNLMRTCMQGVRQGGGQQLSEGHGAPWRTCRRGMWLAFGVEASRRFRVNAGRARVRVGHGATWCIAALVTTRTMTLAMALVTRCVVCVPRRGEGDGGGQRGSAGQRGNGRAERWR